MLDLTTLVKRYFTVKLPNGRTLDVEVPKVKTMKKILRAAEEVQTKEGSEGAAFSSLTEALSLALSKNKQGVHITSDELEELLDYDDMELLMTSYFEWVAEVKSSKN